MEEGREGGTRVTDERRPGQDVLDPFFDGFWLRREPSVAETRRAPGKKAEEQGEQRQRQGYRESRLCGAGHPVRAPGGTPDVNLVAGAGPGDGPRELRRCLHQDQRVPLGWVFLFSFPSFLMIRQVWMMVLAHASSNRPPYACIPNYRTVMFSW